MKYFSTLEDIYDYGMLCAETDKKKIPSAGFKSIKRPVSKANKVIVKNECGTDNEALVWFEKEPDNNTAVVKERGRAANAWLKVFHQHKAVLRGYIKNIVRSDHEADDLLQDTFLKVWQLNRNQEIGSPRAFIFRIAQNLAFDSLRRKKVRKIYDAYDERQEEIEDKNPGSERTLEAKQELGLLFEAVKTLPPKCRQVFLYRKMHGLSHREIAEKLGLSVRTVENHVANGVRECRAFMKKRGSD